MLGGVFLHGFDTNLESVARCARLLAVAKRLAMALGVIIDVVHRRCAVAVRES